MAAPAMAADGTVVVCKYVSTPGERERLQVVIEPNVASLGPGFTGEFPYEFADAQIRSVAIGFEDEGLDISDCPLPAQPPDEPLTETRENSFCVEPRNGILVTVVEQRTGVRTYVWDGDSWEPQDTWGEWMEVSRTTAPSAQCAPTVVVVPTVFDAGPTPPTCEAAGALPTLGTFPNVTLTWDRAFTGPGEYTLTATTAPGFTFPDGTTVKTRTFVVLGAIGYQSDDPEAPCYRAEEPVEVMLATPSIHDVCGTADDSAELPAASTGVTYRWLDEEDPTETDVIAVVAEGYVVPTVPAGWDETEEGVFVYVQADLTDVPCPVPASAPPAQSTSTTLPMTGGGVPLVVPLAAVMTLLLGAAAAAYGAVGRRRA